MAIFKGGKQNPETAAAAAPPEVTPFAVSTAIPASINKQTHASESRVALQSFGVAYAQGKVNDVITPSMTAMALYANTILAFNALAPLTKNYAPNEGPSLLYDLQKRLGL